METKYYALFKLNKICQEILRQNTKQDWVVYRRFKDFISEDAVVNILFEQ